VKFLPQEFAADHEAALGLLREAEAVALINHPNICTIYEIDHDGGASFIVMERLEGVSLQVHLARGRLQTKEIIGHCAAGDGGVGRGAREGGRSSRYQTGEHLRQY
jgi:serine/threonine protein kinase